MYKVFINENLESFILLCKYVQHQLLKYEMDVRKEDVKSMVHYL